MTEATNRATAAVEPDTRYQVAYEEAKRAVEYQQGALRDLRGRAGSLISIAAGVTSFIAGVGLLNTDSTKGEVIPQWSAYSLVALLVAIGVLSMAVLWPTRWNFTVNADALIKQHVESPESTPSDQLYRYLAIELQDYYTGNRAKLHSRNNQYRLGLALLLVEVIVIVLAIT